MAPKEVDKQDVIDLGGGKGYAGQTTPKNKSITVRISRFTARNPLKCLIGTLVFVTVLSYIGLYVGKFKIEVDNKGWRSRKTTISKREMQSEVLNTMRRRLFNDDDGSVWEEIQNNNLYGYVDLGDRDYEDRRRALNEAGDGDESSCDTDWYDSWDAVYDNNVFAMWKVQPDEESATKNILDKDVLSQICDAETKSLDLLKEIDGCGGCSDVAECLPPHSLTLVLRYYVGGGYEMTCSDLMGAYTTDIQQDFTDTLVTCTQQMKDSWDPVTEAFIGDMSACPQYFIPHLVDVGFAVNGNTSLRYTASYFNTKPVVNDDGDLELDSIYEQWESFDGADGINVVGVYDTIDETFSIKLVDALTIADMGLAVASMSITFIAMGIHTRSFFLTFFGVLQIIYAIPLAYFFYTFVAQLKFFPFLNFIGVFVAAALGADDLFVAVDKWKNARIKNADGTVEDIAEIALPDAASAMFLTTSTTAAAFFATCICPVSPILCFAVFCGMMIIFNYVMNVLIVFPALCIYDNWIQGGSRNCLVTCFHKEREESTPDFINQDKSEMSFIHRILSTYADLLQRFRWPILGICAVGIAVCVYFGLTLSLPDSSDVRLLPEGHPLENHFMWKQVLLSATLFSSGSVMQIHFGLIPGDTGNPNNPDDLSKLLLDETFEPSASDSQEYLLNYCSDLFAQDFADLPYGDYECPINVFDKWLQSNSLNQDSDLYKENCNDATGVPMNPEYFDACIIAWSQDAQDKSVLADRGVVKTITFEAKSDIRIDSPHSKIDETWNAWEDWFIAQSSIAPAGTNKPFNSAPMWWWYDTNEQMVKTATGAVAIALAFSAVIVLLSSRSLTLTLLSFGCILYVLAATTASLVALGWDLGFLESICFAILVGISCDFIIHFGHAYIHQNGSVSKEIRSKFALIHMGPSILAAAVTTFASSIMMLFCKIVFFTKFAMILFMTILHATIGSFVVYIVLTTIFGPAEPTKLIDGLVAKVFKKGQEAPEGIVSEEEKIVHDEHSTATDPK